MTLLADLRTLAPNRGLSQVEAFGVAERQALRLLRRSGVLTGPAPSEVITGLPFVQVALRPLRSSSGAARWVKPRWVVLLNSLEPGVRQRFSLAHEFKHILDHPRRKATGTLTPTQNDANERLCDYFAACLLMPRPWVKAAWASGDQDIVSLARRFEVSPQAMQVRLLDLGLIDRYGRCRGIDNDAITTYLRSQPVSPLELAA